MLVPLELIVKIGFTSVDGWRGMVNNLPIVARWSLLNQLIIKKNFTIKIEYGYGYECGYSYGYEYEYATASIL